MSESTPLISVILPVYNAQDYIVEAVQSILNQTFTDFEFLIYDDGSKDDSVKLIEQLAAKDDRIRLTAQGHSGYVPLLNQGISEARGSLLARMDADDVALPQRFGKQVAYMQVHRECVLVGAQIIQIDSAGKPFLKSNMPTKHEDIDASLMRGSVVIKHPTIMMRREAAVAIGSYRDEFECAEDLDLFLRMAEHGRVANMDDVLLRYRMHHQNVGSLRQAEQTSKIRPIVEEAHERRGLPFPDDWEDKRSGTMTRAQRYGLWAWQAAAQGRVPIARRLATQAVVNAPWSRDAWIVLATMIRRSLWRRPDDPPTAKPIEDMR